jgi:cysteine desulfurase
MLGSIYFDWNATTPPHPDVLGAMREAAESDWANPSSIHAPGRRARRRVEAAREAIARLLGFDVRDVVLTSGGTEANNLALAMRDPGPGKAVVVNRVEHPSVVRAIEKLAERGVHVEWVLPNPAGVVSLDAILEAVERASQKGAVELASLQSVNQETGVLQPVAAVAEELHARGIKLHVDAIQAIGRLGPESWAGADYVTVGAHKFRGPKGIGALAARPGISIVPVVLGGSQERGIRPGTQDPIACAGFAVAAERARGAEPLRSMATPRSRPISASPASSRSRSAATSA